MNLKLKIIMRLSRNILIALISAVWLLPFWISAKYFLDNMAWLEQNKLTVEETLSENYPFWASISPFSISLLFVEIGVILLGVAIVFWAFVAANKLWPIKAKPKGEQKE